MKRSQLWIVVLVGGSLVWDRQLPYRPIDGLHEGHQLAWANCALHGQKPQLDVRTMYGFFQITALASVLKWCGMTVMTFR